MHPTLLFLLLLPLLSLAQTDSSSQPIYTITITATGKPTLVWTTPPGNAPHSEVPYHQKFTAYFNTIQTPLSGSVGLGNIKGRVGVSRSYPLKITQKPNISLSPSSTGVVRQDLNIYPDGNLKKPTWATIVASGGGTYNYGPTYSQNIMDLTSGTSSLHTSSANTATTVIGSSATEEAVTSSTSTTFSTSSTGILISSTSTSTALSASSSVSTVSLTESPGDKTTSTISTSSETALGAIGETPTSSSLSSTPGIVVTPATATTTSSSTPAGAAINTPTTSTKPDTNTLLVETTTSSTSLTSLTSTPGIAVAQDTSTVPSTATTPA